MSTLALRHTFFLDGELFRFPAAPPARPDS
jgi:hypothetical protein